MYDLISIGGISIDLFYQGKALTYNDGRFQLAVGGKYFTTSFTESVGGSGANIAIGVVNHGLKVAVRGIIGNNPFKNIILNKLKEKNIATDLCQFEDNYFNVSSILLTESGERSIIIYRSPHQHIICHEEELMKFKNTKMVYLGNLPDVNFDERIKLLSYLKKNNVSVMINAGLQNNGIFSKNVFDLLNKATIVILNTHEFADLTNIPIGKINFKTNVVLEYSRYLKDQTVIITDGKNGSYGYYDDKVIYQKAFKTSKILDTTGAGDAYSAGFIADWLRNKNLQKAMENGAKYSIKILSKIGAN